MESTTMALENFASDFVVDNGKIFAADTNGNVFCFDGQTGQSLWNASVGVYNGMGAVLETGQGHLYIGVRGGIAKVLDENSGSTILQTQAPTDSDIDSRTAPSITVAFNVFLVSTASDTKAYSTATGALFWSNSIGGPLFWGHSYSQLYVPFGNDSLFCILAQTAINAFDGSELWKIQGYADAAPIFVGDRAFFWNYKSLADYYQNNNYFGPATRLFCVNSTTDASLWTFNVGAQMYQPTVTNDSVYVGAADGNLYAINLKDGTLEWKEFVDYQHLSGNFSAGSQQKSVALGGSQVLVDEGRLFYNMALNSSQSGYNGSVVCLNAINGSKIWSLPVQGNNTVGYTASLSLFNGTLFATQQGDLYLINEQQGKIELKLSFDHYILPPIIADNTLYVAADLNIYAFKTK